MGRRDETITLSFEIESGKLRQSTRGIADLEDSLDRIDRAARQIDTRLESTGSEMAEMGKDAQRATKGVNNLTEALDKQNRELKERNQAMQGGRGRAGDGKAGGVDTGKIGGGIGAIGRLAGGLGLGPVADIANVVDDLSDVLERLPEMRGELSGLAGIAGEATPAIGGMGVSIATIGAAALIAAPALIAMALAIKKFIEDQQRMQAILAATIDAQATYFELLHTSNAEQIQAALSRIEMERQIAAETKAFYEAQFEQLTFWDKALTNADKQLKDAIKEQDDALIKYDAQIAVHREALTDLSTGTNKLTIAQNQAAMATRREEAAQLNLAKNLVGGALAVSQFGNSILNFVRNLFSVQSGGGGTDGGTKGGIRRRQYGGPLAAGQLALVNEGVGQMEGFRVGGATYALPGGVGLFTPLRGGTIVNNAGGIRMGFNVQGSSGQILSQIHGLIDNRLASVLEAIFD